MQRHLLNPQIASVRCADEFVVTAPHSENLMSNSNDSRLARSELRPTAASRTSPALVKAIGIAFVVSLIGLGIACQLKAQQQQELHKQLIAASLALLFGACFGGIVKMLLDEAVAEKRRRDDAAAFVANVLADLKKVYDHVERARLLIPAHQSAKTYGDEMREDVTAGVVQLRNVIRALQGRVAGVPVGLQQLVRPEVEEMKRYLLELMDEFCDEYKHLADLQRFHESRAEKLAKAFAEGSADIPQEQMPSFVWSAVKQLPRLTEFMQGGREYQTRFIGPLDAASAELRNAHARLNGHCW